MIFFLTLYLQVRAVLMLSWLSFGHAEEIAGVSMQPVPTVQGGTWAFGTFLGGTLGVAGSLGEFQLHLLLKSSKSCFCSKTNW